MITCQHCSMHNAQCSLLTVRCRIPKAAILYSAHCSFHYAWLTASTLRTALCTLCALCTLLFAHFVHSALCSLHTLCTLHIALCTLCALCALLFAHFVHCAGDRKRAGALDVLSSPSTEGYHLLQRARHVATEAQRVWSFREVCEREPYGYQLNELGESQVYDSGVWGGGG